MKAHCQPYFQGALSTDLAPYCHYPTGVCTFLIPGSSEARIAFAQAKTSDQLGKEQEHLIHWPISILSN